jgi:hypothetical protein
MSRAMVESDLLTLIRHMRPEQVPGRFVFVRLPDSGIEGLDALATVREEEGLSAVVGQSDADRHGLEYDFVAAWITLRIESALSAVGLTAAVSNCLTAQGISCNVVAGLRHDHLLVPVEDTDEAIGALESLSASASG